MADARPVEFAPFSAPRRGILVVFCGDSLAFGAATTRFLRPCGDLVTKAAAAQKFTGKSGAVLDIVMPRGLRADRLVVIGLGKVSDIKPVDMLRFGGMAMGQIPRSVPNATVVGELPAGALTPAQAVDLALGMRLRSYRFERYKTKPAEGALKASTVAVTIAVRQATAARRAWAAGRGLGEGVMLARDLVNEPANVLFPKEFARRAMALRKLGVDIDMLGEPQMKRLGMGALIGVGQGSEHDSRIVVMRWNGGKRGVAPVAFVGKGVCFDTGGISIKPASGMEDMKGDMGGAACVVGLMHAIAARKAGVNVIGAIGLVENMPDGRAQRPGDIVRSMSGQTIEIINTDAEGRLVLADVLHYVNKKYKPRVMIDLATLTGAIMVALGQEYAGLFCNDDTLATRLTAAGEATGEKVWRMPLGKEYDKMIDSKFADMKNTGGRHGGAITAAQFLQRFVGRTPWAHLDIAGTALGSPQTEINKSWSAGWGVRLLDRLLADVYEK
ncbi:MAG: leucyl aminopeptidase [Proteobacteria bacterium]|nr:leucyl aminopeptidase [Pseudomonadota bacterium]